MLITNEQFSNQVQATVQQLDQLADGLAVDGLLTASGVLLQARQCIRVLWSKLQPPAPPTETPAPETDA